MAEFDELQKKLQQSRAATVEAQARMATARGRLTRLQARQRALDRTFDPRKRSDVAERKRLAQQIKDASREVGKLEAAATKAIQAQSAAIGTFGRLIQDPRQAIATFEDRFPILMLPVRLET